MEVLMGKSINGMAIDGWLGYNLVGGDWNHGMDYDFPFSWEIHHDLNSMIFQKGRAKNHQPDDHTMENHHV